MAAAAIKFSKFGLKCLFRPPKIMFLGSFDPQTLFFIVETLINRLNSIKVKTPQKHDFWGPE